MNRIILSMSVMTLFDGGEALLTYLFSTDRGWWPVSLSFQLIGSAVYCAAFIYAGRSRNLSASYILFFLGSYRLTRLIFAYFFYSEIEDWSAINERAVEMSVFQQIIYNQWTPYILTLASMLVHLIYCQSRKLRV
jgi:hypothetical protein